MIPTRIKTIDELGLPPVLKKIASEERGLVLVTGTTGSGKSTTLAAMIDYINSTPRGAHHDGRGPDRVPAPGQPLDRQPARSHGRHAVVLARAARAPSARTPTSSWSARCATHETVETALLAAETGHLVFSTLHTLDATETINRIIAVFPPHQQRQVRIQLASVLKGAVSQRLLPRADGMGRVPAVEVMIDHRRSSATASSTRTGPPRFTAPSRPAPRSTACRRSIRRSSASTQQGLVTLEEALRWATNVDEFKLKVRASRRPPTWRATKWPGMSAAPRTSRGSGGNGDRPHSPRS